jgi:hypothetical protein
MKEKAKIREIVFTCIKSNTDFIVNGNDVEFSISVTPCDMYGSHDYVEASAKCPYCNMYHDIKIRAMVIND